MIKYIVNKYELLKPIYQQLTFASGDRMVADAANTHSWMSPQNVDVTMIYPADGIGAILTYIEIKVIQDSNEGEVHILSGGIGQREIKIVVKAFNTRKFTYYCEWYGS